MQLAAEKGVSYLFEASVGGGIPILRPLSQCLAALGGTLILEVGQSGVLVMRTDDLVCLQMSRRKPALLRAKEEKEQKKAVQAAA